MKHLKWSISRNDKSINGVCRTVADAHALLQKLSQMTAPDIAITINAQDISKDQAMAQVSELVASEQAKFEQTYRAIHVKTGACAFAANTKKVWVKR